MKTKEQIKERMEMVQQLADVFYKEWQEACDGAAYRIYRQYVQEIRALKWVLED